MELIRAVIENVEDPNSIFRTHNSVGRAGEGLSGKIMQHYGLRTNPPPGTDILTIQDGNNNYSIAEASASGFTTNVPQGDVAVYSRENSIIHLSGDNSLIDIRVKKPGSSSQTELDIQLDANANTINLLFSTPSGQQGGIYLNTGNDGKIIINNALLIDLPPVTPIVNYQGLTNVTFLDAIRVFMTALASATDPVVVAAAAAFSAIPSNTLYTHSVEGV